MTGDNQNIIDDCQNDLDRIKHYIKEHPLDSICQYLICYSVVRASGVLEVVAKNIIFSYLSQNAVPEAVRFLEKEIVDSSWNPSCGRIQKILDKISPRWSREFQVKTHGTKEKSDLNSLINLRNDFAHGQMITASIENIEEYFHGSCQVLRWLGQIVR